MTLDKWPDVYRVTYIAERAMRYVPFNVQALVDVATEAAGANRCTSIGKVQDGMYIISGAG